MASVLGDCPIVLGTMRLTSWGANMDAAAVAELLTRAHKAGVTCIDTADIYGNYTVEAVLGEALALLDADVRSSFKLATKFGIRFVCEARPDIKRKGYDSSREYAQAAVQKSVELLRQEPDLVMVHRPDPLTPAKELAFTLATLCKEGKCKSAGVSNYSSAQLMSLVRFWPPMGARLAVNQIELSLLKHEALFDGTVDTCMELGVAVMAYSPLGNGAMFADGYTPANPAEAAVLPALQAVAARHSTTADIVAIAWLLRHPARIYPVIGTTRADRVEAVVAGAPAVAKAMTRDEWYDLLVAARGGEELP